MPKADAEYLWSDLNEGFVLTEPGSSRLYHTGDWRVYAPVLDRKLCVKCGTCWLFCPDISYQKNDDGFYLVDLNFCKGCGICAQECPTGAIRMEEEKEV